MSDDHNEPMTIQILSDLEDSLGADCIWSKLNLISENWGEDVPKELFELWNAKLNADKELYEYWDKLKRVLNND